MKKLLLLLLLLPGFALAQENNCPPGHQNLDSCNEEPSDSDTGSGSNSNSNENFNENTNTNENFNESYNTNENLNESYNENLNESTNTNENLNESYNANENTSNSESYNANENTSESTSQNSNDSKSNVNISDNYESFYFATNFPPVDKCLLGSQGGLKDGNVAGWFGFNRVNDSCWLQMLAEAEQDIEIRAHLKCGDKKYRKALAFDYPLRDRRQVCIDTIVEVWTRRIEREKEIANQCKKASCSYTNGVLRLDYIDE